MPPTRRNNIWFIVFLVLAGVVGYGLATYAVAGTQLGCGGSGTGQIKWVNSPIPKFDCVSRGI